MTKPWKSDDPAEIQTRELPISWSCKGKSPGNHLFVNYSVINETLNSKHQRVIIFYDVRECYDSLWVKQCFFDMFENGISNNLLNLMYQQSK